MTIIERLVNKYHTPYKNIVSYYTKLIINCGNEICKRHYHAVLVVCHFSEISNKLNRY